MTWGIDICIEDGLVPRLSQRWLRAIARRALEALGSRPARLSLVIAGEATVRKLNRTYLSREGITDVLAFPLTTADFPSPPRHPSPLGEVIICLPQAVRQAAEAGQSIRREVALLVIHGILHLLSYDDTQPQAELRMRQAEARLLAESQELW